MNRFKFNKNKSDSIFGVIAFIIITTVGVLYAVPNWGGFKGIIWTGFAIAFLLYYIIKLFSSKDGKMFELVDEDGNPVDEEFEDEYEYIRREKFNNSYDDTDDDNPDETDKVIEPKEHNNSEYNDSLEDEEIAREKERQRQLREKAIREQRESELRKKKERLEKERLQREELRRETSRKKPSNRPEVEKKSREEELDRMAREADKREMQRRAMDGKNIDMSTDTYAEKRLIELRRLYMKNLITKEEYEAKRKKIIDTS